MVDTLTLNEALRIHIELVADIDLDKMEVTSDERGLFIQGKLHQILNIIQNVVNIDDITDESILNEYTICIDFADTYISFLRKED